MIYYFSLQLAGLVTGLILCLLGALGFAMDESARNFMAAFPRSRNAGIVILAVDLAWSFWLISTMEMGEFSAFRRPFLVILPVGFFLTLRFVDEFLAVRALGVAALLALVATTLPSLALSARAASGHAAAAPPSSVGSSHL